MITRSAIVKFFEKTEDWILQTGGKMLDFAVKVVAALIIYLIIRKILKIFCEWLDRKMERFKVDPSIKSFILSLTKYGILIASIVTIVIKLNIVAASSIAAMIVSAGAAVSLALQGGLSNFAGGLILLLLKPFQVGDYIVVKAASVEGTVKKLELYYTTVLTLDNQMISIPNSTLTNNTIVNVTAMDDRFLEIKVGISYQSDIQKARNILERLLDEDPDTRKENRMIFVDELSQSAVVMALRVWVPADRYWSAKWRLNEQIKLSFDQEGIGIPYNQLDVHLHTENDRN